MLTDHNVQINLGVAIPAYKREDTLSRLLDSIGQAAPVCVSDNGSHLSEEFKSNFPWVKFLSDAEVPVLANWNRAARGMDTDWIVMPGDDDLYYVDSFEKIKLGIARYPDADILFFGHHIIDETDNISSTWIPAEGSYSPPNGLRPLMGGVMARPPSIVFKSALFAKLGGFCSDFVVTAGDSDFYQRAALVGKVAFVSEVVSGYRVWASGSTKQTIATQAWLKEIEYWCSRIRALSIQSGFMAYDKSAVDRVYMSNLQAGVRVLLSRRQWKQAWLHVLKARYPFRARFKEHIRLALMLFVGVVR